MASRIADMGRIALVFPGQGSQFVGMGAQLIEQSPAARATLAAADDILGIPLSRTIAEGPSEELEDTVNAQPAILAVSIAALEAVRERLQDGERLDPVAVAGHSLGEFSAMVAAGAISYEDALRLVRERGRLMKDAGITAPGGMAAILGLDDDQIAAVCEAAAPAGVIVPANRNCPGQTVISGEVGALEQAMELAKERGARRVARLNVSIASHSPLMAEANAEFQKLLAAAVIADPATPVIGNVSAGSITTAQGLRDELALQMERPVDWTGSVMTIAALPADSVLELGPGSVLGSLVKRIDKALATATIADLGLDLPGITPA